jgi:hypothetical protein
VFKLNATRFPYWKIFIHDRDHRIKNDGGTFGSSYSLESRTLQSKNHTLNSFLDIYKTDANYVDAESARCDVVSKRVLHMEMCIEEYINTKIMCRLPWQTSVTHKEKCSTQNQYRHYLQLYSEIRLMSDANVPKNTGCLPKCHRNEYRQTYSYRYVGHEETKDSFLQGFYRYPGINNN